MATDLDPSLALGSAGRGGPADHEVSQPLAFLEEDARDQDAHSAMFRMLNLGLNLRLDLLNRIISKCERQPNGCLLWRGPDSGTGRGGGYGRFSFEGVTASVHRVVYSICYGPIPGKKQIDHSCSNRRCCNPEHLVRMTHKKNQKLRDARKNYDHI